ncbi:hypothetical protein G3I13_11865 [Streptomyces sp. SID6673]|nr:hypothetical protein [Streptomyces sp. SID11726]NEB25032.1 hypothetical protein [Streptomyces sp. SID6673]
MPNPRSEDRELDDATVDLFGLGSSTVTRGLWAFAVVYTVVTIAAGWHIRSVHNWAGLIAGLMIFAVATVIVQRTGGPRFPVSAAISAAVLAVCGLAISLWSLPADSYLQLQTAPPVSAATIVFTLLAVHGRPSFAWAGAVCGTLIAGLWGMAIGFGFVTGAGNTAFCYPVLVLAMLFVLMARPLAERIHVLRERAVAQAATEAATAAAAAERGRQLSQLERRARPILSEIVGGHEFTIGEVADVRLTEAQLRDGIRAPAWESDRVRDAVWQARRRGVSVLLLDDGALSVAPDRDLMHRLCDVLVDELEAVDSGQVIARVLPPGRSLVASIVVNTGPTIRRIEYGVGGEMSEHSPTVPVATSDE